jgi:hypothetical protein
MGVRAADAAVEAVDVPLLVPVPPGVACPQAPSNREITMRAIMLRGRQNKRRVNGCFTVNLFRGSFIPVSFDIVTV